MGYENAPATKMLATHCAVCARPLVDAVSVETGIGPECRKKYGFNATVDPKAREEANRLVFEIACQQRGFYVIQACRALRGLGFERLATTIATRVIGIHIEVVGNDYVVTTPYTEAGVAAFRRIPGRRWDSARKANLVPMANKRWLSNALNEAFKGAAALGPKGPFIVGGEQPEVAQ